jgi:hypothetical protein
MHLHVFLEVFVLNLYSCMRFEVAWQCIQCGIIGYDGVQSGILVPVKIEVTLRPTVSRPVCLGVRRPSGTRDQFYFLLEIFLRQLRVCNFVTPSLTRGRVCNLL